MEATKVRDLPTSRSGASQSLWRLDPPLVLRDWDGEQTSTTEHVVVSSVNAMFTGPETYIFPADEGGEVTDWLELSGSYRGGYDHQEAIDGLVASVSAEV